MIGKTNVKVKPNKKIVFETLPENTKLLMHFEDNLNDEMGLNVIKMSTGDAVYDEGKFEKAIKLNGSSFVEIPRITENVLGSNDFTIAGWFKMYQINGNHCFFSNSYSNYYAGLQVWYSLGNKAISFCVNTGSGSSTYTRKNITATLAVDTWYHIALVRKGTTITLYLNGTSIGSVTFSGSLYHYSTAPWRIGSSNTTSTSPREGLWGVVDEFIIVNGTALWTENFTPPENSYGGASI